MQPQNIPPNFDVTVRVGCSLVYEVTGTASLLLNLKLHPDRNHAVLFEALTLGDNLPAEDFVDSHGNHVCRVELAHGTNCFRHDAIVAVSSQPDNHDLVPTCPQAAGRPPRCLAAVYAAQPILRLRQVDRFRLAAVRSDRARHAAGSGHQPLAAREH